MSDGDDSDVPDKNFDFDIQPYQFEPRRIPARPTTPVDTESGSDGDSDNEDEEMATAARRRDSAIVARVSMSTEEECVCQEIPRVLSMTQEREVTCITEDGGFVANCLNKDVLVVSVFYFSDQNGPIGDNEPAHE
ncbi:uncharacterized protein LOC132564965 [Ylistrum balloti]|uniref:uncharacterized protein LOC132564965 n=1 Tax=Ylistrum balloti TaxID=509963 RepID=UPI002905F5BB|nr:uncharacterized protein LOC132564965 [Ylistrum balloti]